MLFDLNYVEKRNKECDAVGDALVKTKKAATVINRYTWSLYLINLETYLESNGIKK